jgi:peptide/nickel transport system substrate-binding protein
MKNVNRFKKAITLLLIAVLIMSMVGCGSKDTTNEQTSSETENETVGIDNDATATVTFYGVCYRYDPHKTTSYGDWCILNQLHDTLVVTDFDGQTIKPGLATKWEISDDRLEYVFYLRDDVSFHSGKPMTAQDVKWTFDRWKDQETASPTARYIKSVETIEVVDDYTVKLKLSRPDNNILANLATIPAAILNKEAVEAEGESYGTTAVDGTGPFKFVEYIQDDRTIVERNDDYKWAPSIFNNPGPAHLKRIVFRFILEPGTRSMEYQAGNIDIIANAGMFASELDLVKRNVDFFAVEEFFPPYPVFIGFQLDRGPDKTIRKACNMALDREEFIQTILNGFGVPMPGVISPGFWEWEGSKDYYPYDIDAAIKLLEDDGYILKDDGFRYKGGKKASFAVIHCSSDEDKMLANIFQAQMKKIGIDVIVDSSKQNQYWSFINTNEFEALIIGLFLNTPEDMLYNYFHSDNLPFPNRQGFSNPEVDELLSYAIEAPSDEERQKAYDRVQEIVLEEALLVPVFNRNGFIVYNNRLKGFKAHSTCVEGIPKIIDIYVEK